MILRLEEIDSTNSYAKANIDSFEDKTVIHALKQTKGRGRLNRLWVDLGEGNLFVSIVLKPSNEYLPLYSNITQYTSLVLCNVLDEFGVHPKIKWPNDVMIDGLRKISGILCETVMEAHELQGIIVGVGVNLNAEKSMVESVPDRVVTSLNLETGKSVDRYLFLEKFINEFFKNYEKFLKEGFSMLEKEYLKRSCFLNKEVNIQVLNEVKSGLVKGLSSDGGLILQTDDKKELELTIGDIL